MKLGILPGSGGTQRLPRLVPMAQAVEMMTTGNPIPAEKAKELGLVDEIAQGDLLDSAVNFSKTIIGKPFRRVRDLKAKLEGDPKAFFEQAREQVKKASRGYPAPLVILGCAEASLKPFDEGRKSERERFARLVDSPESKALRHMFFAERQTTKIPDVPEDTPMREVRKAAVVGAGTMGGGIAMSFANAGIPVMLVDTTQEALDQGPVQDQGQLRGHGVQGPARRSPTWTSASALIQGTINLGQVADADIVIEAVFERMDVKKDMFRKLDGIVKQGAILATNTSTLDVDEIAAATTRPQDVIGTHFFSPANVMRLLEVVRGEEDRQGRARHHHEARQDPEEGAGGLGRVRRLHRQPHAGEIRPAEPVPARRGREPAAGRRRAQEVRHGHGAVHHVRHGGQRHRLGDPEAPLRGAPRLRLLEGRRPRLRARPLRPEDRQGLLPVRAGQPQADPRS